MSNDSPKSKEKSTEKSTPPAGAKGIDSEVDLWDLDEERESKTKQPTREVDRAIIPSKRTKQSSVYTKKPAELKVDTEAAEEVVVEIDPIDSEHEKKPETTQNSPDTKASQEKKNIATAEPKQSESADKVVLGDTETHGPVSDVSETVDKEPSGTEPKSAQESSDTKPIPSSLSKIEKSGIVVLLLFLAAAAIFSIVHFASRLEFKPLIGDELSLPIEGKMTTITSVDTFWREPITAGENPDTVKRGVELIPVIKMEMENNSSGSGAVRVLFKNDQEVFVGDNITRTIPASGTLEIGATDGFHDLGMHAAYRTGSSDRWVVQVLEGPSVRAPIEKFKILFETEISTDMR